MPDVLSVPRALGLVVAACLAISGCTRKAPEASTATTSAAAISDIRVLPDENGIYVYYKTHTALRDAAAQQAEMPVVWRDVVRPRLQASWTRVTLFPEDPSGQSASFGFERDPSGGWRAPAPHVVRIPD